MLLNCPLKRGKLSFKAVYSLQKFVVLYGGTALETHFQLSSQFIQMSLLGCNLFFFSLQEILLSRWISSQEREKKTEEMP